MEIGVDCVDISRFDKSGMLFSNNLKRVFTEKEISYCEKKENPAQHYAVRFAGKEAVKKALSNYKIELSLSQIEILNGIDGIPFVNILNDNTNGLEIKISLSHSKTIAVAFAVINNKFDLDR